MIAPGLLVSRTARANFLPGSREETTDSETNPSKSSIVCALPYIVSRIFPLPYLIADFVIGGAELHVRH